MENSLRWTLAWFGAAALILAIVWKQHRPVATRPTLPGDDVVLAVVNGSPITEYDLSRTIRTTLGAYSQSQLGQDGRRKVLESIVASRAIAQAEASKLSAERLLDVDRKAAAFREQSLVNEYLKTNGPPAPVTQAMIRKYYDEHPDKYGGTTTRSYEMVFTERPPNAVERPLASKELASAESEKDWSVWVSKLRKKSVLLTYRAADLDPKTLDARLAKIVTGLGEGKTSPVSFVDGRAYVVRVTKETAGARRPLAEVSGEIHDMLALSEARTSVKAASDRVLKEAKVEYR